MYNITFSIPRDKTIRFMTDLIGFLLYIPSLITPHIQHTHKHIPCVIGLFYLFIWISHFEELL